MPNLSRWPLPWPVAAAAIFILWRRQKFMVAVGIALSFLAYLRPGEMHTLQVRSLVPPVDPGSRGATGRWSLVVREQGGPPTKTGTFDDSVILDRPDVLYLDKLWRGLKKNRAPHAQLIPISQLHFASEVKASFEEVGAQKLNIVAYSLHHGGASRDFLQRFRDRWRSSTSVLRYQKSTKVLSAMHQLTPRMRDLCKMCGEQLDSLLEDPSVDPVLPGRAAEPL